MSNGCFVLHGDVTKTTLNASQVTDTPVRNRAKRPCPDLPSERSDGPRKEPDLGALKSTLTHPTCSNQVERVNRTL